MLHVQRNVKMEKRREDQRFGWEVLSTRFAGAFTHTCAKAKWEGALDCTLVLKKGQVTWSTFCAFVVFTISRHTQKTLRWMFNSARAFLLEKWEALTWVPLFPSCRRKTQIRNQPFYMQSKCFETVGLRACRNCSQNSHQLHRRQVMMNLIFSHSASSNSKTICCCFYWPEFG